MRSAVTVVTAVITVAAGVFAPGHLGELTRIVPFELVDAVLEEEGGREKRVRLLPSRVGVYFLLAACLFPGPSYPGVWGKLTAGLRSMGLARPSETALRAVCRRVGERPLQRLFEVLAGPLGRPRTPGIMFRGLRTVSFDGMKSVKVPDTAANRAWLGKAKAALGVTGYPALSVMTLVETGTRALLGAVSGPAAGGETGQARQLLHLLDATMLVLMDRGFDGGTFLAAVAATKAQFLVRLTSTRVTPVLKRLPDGSFLSLIGGARVRIILAEVTVTCHDGTVYGDSYRLATTLLDHREYPAEDLIGLYHERWQHEITYLALRHTLLKGRVLRSQDPAGIRQETWALLAVYQALRIAVTDAVQSVPGLDPDRASWTVALETARDLAVTAQNITDPDGSDLAGEIGRAVLAGLHGPRRPRVCARKVKSPLSRWNKHPAGKPRETKTITAVTSTVIPALPLPAEPGSASPAGQEGSASEPSREPAGTGTRPETDPAGAPETEEERPGRHQETAAGTGARQASRPGRRMPVRVLAISATLHALPGTQSRPGPARRPQAPPRARPQPRSQAKRRVTVNAGITGSDKGNTRSRTSSKNMEPGEPLDDEPDSLTAPRWPPRGVLERVRPAEGAARRIRRRLPPGAPGLPGRQLLGPLRHRRLPGRDRAGGRRAAAVGRVQRAGGMAVTLGAALHHGRVAGLGADHRGLHPQPRGRPAQAHGRFYRRRRRGWRTLHHGLHDNRLHRRQVRLVAGLTAGSGP
jgi:hypothetical protein